MSRKRNRKKSYEKSSETTLNSDIAGIAILGFGVFSSLSMFFTSFTGIIGIGMRKLLFTIIGLGAYVLPIFLIFIGICYIIKRGKINFSKRFYGIILMFINTLMIIQMNVLDQYFINNSISEGIKRIYISDDIIHGGVVSYLIDIPIYKLFGNGCVVIFISLYLVAFLLISQKSLGDIIAKRIHKRTKTAPVIKEENSFDDNKIEENSNYEKPLTQKISDKIKIVDFLKNDGNLTDGKSGQHNDDIKINDSLSKSDNENISKELESEIEQNSNSELEIDYECPPLSLLNQNEMVKLNKSDKKELLSSAEKLTDTLNSFGVDAKVIQVSRGPSVTRYELQPSAGVKVSKIVNLADDIALNLASAGVRIEAPIPGKAAIGIEVPNKELTSVFLSEVIESDAFLNAKSNLAFALGKDIGGNCVVTDLTKMPHLLIAGATGSGKSVCINTLIISLLYKYPPADVKLLMIDPKVVELNIYNGIPHLLIPVVTNPKKAAGALNWAVNEMTRRYKMFADNNVRNVEGYNELCRKTGESKMPWIVIIIDELADLMMVCPNDVEDYIGRLAQMARAAGMHLVIATQRPSVDVITGVIKANIPSRISFAVSSQIDSRTILDVGGAEKLLGKGDMLFNPVGESKPLRIQGAFISEEEVERIVGFIKNQVGKSEYKEEIMEEINNTVENSNSNDDELLNEALKVVLENNQASTSLIQRKLRIGYNRAARIIEQMEEKGYISQRDGSKPRNILITKEEIEAAQ
ncbi:MULTISPECIES: FtsK/SpoIIIE family DNA translocase [Clostridium]|uniref:FtsK/SpoIIIE family DNA translocase n=1 Tax=Clostridium TaxID=1485 RepID=UPI00069F77E3|nr:MULTISPECIES: DNA translocase FtsK [Clostridium]KOF56708.1 cell division protein FtsK [Clostridium sp. DMHC 10]